ncbi:MAG: hypothetical protein AB7E80_14255 [Hyphomicrobiaceae bacterium]
MSRGSQRCGGSPNSAVAFTRVPLAAAVAVTTICTIAVTASAEVRGPAMGTRPDPAHAIAERFANSGTSRADDDARRLKSYEDEMLRRARAEADARAKADLARESERAKREAAARADDERRAAEERQLAQDEQARRKAAERERETRSLSDRLRAVRETREREKREFEAEAQARKAATERRQQALAEHVRRLSQRVADGEKRPAEARRFEDEQKAAEAHRIEAERQAMEARRTEQERQAAEARRIQDERQAAEARRIEDEARDFDDEVRAADRRRWSDRRDRDVIPSRVGHVRDGGDEADRVTVLIVMTPGKRGIRRWNKTADPMLCVEGSCYISRGAADPAEQLTRARAFGPGVALGNRAGACRGRLTCVFRGIELGGPRAWMQPVDLRIVRHDRRSAHMIKADESCGLSRGRLTCNRTVEDEGYRAWIVPEDVAEAAGAEALEDALRGDLSATYSARAPW